MSELARRIKCDLTEALRSKDTIRVSTLRLLIAAIKNREISLRTGETIEAAGQPAGLTDDQIVEVIGSEIKKRKESILAYEQGKRDDLVSREKAELAILAAYLPAQLTPAELDRIVKEAVAAAGGSSLKDFGRIMGALMPQVKGQADGQAVSEAVKKILSGG